MTSQSLARALLALTLLAAIRDAAAGELREQVKRAAQQNFAEYLDALRIPNVPAPAVRHPAQRGLHVARFRAARLRRAPGDECRHGRSCSPSSRRDPASRPSSSTLHYDGQPVMPSEWSQADPFVPVVRRRNAAGEWQDVARRRLASAATRSRAPRVRTLGIGRQGADHDVADGARCARGSGRAPAFDLKVMLDGEEEIGSPSLGGHGGVRPCGIRCRHARDFRRTRPRIAPPDGRVRQPGHRKRHIDGVRPARAAA